VIDPAGFATARMRAEPIGPQHRDGLVALLGDPRVGQTLAGVRTPAEVDDQIARMAAFHAEHGYGWYAWLERDSGALVARGGLQPARIDGTDEIEVGWAVVPERWGQGLATELGAACVEVAFGPLALDSVVAFTLPGNAGSRRVMEKLGMTYETTTDYKTYGPHVVYRLNREAGAMASTSTARVPRRRARR
jgi:ribosomal-protein-alanine N-acetyltransferase